MGAIRSCVILAGGTGRRIGSEKAFLEFFGSTMIERTEEIVSEVVDDVVVVARDEEQLERLRSTVSGARLSCDSVQGFGPVAGLAAGMAAARGAGSRSGLRPSLHKSRGSGHPLRSR